MIEWWAYKHINGTIHVKRLFDHSDLYEAQESDFVDQVVLLSSQTHAEAVIEANNFFK